MKPTKTYAFVCHRGPFRVLVTWLLASLPVLMSAPGAFAQNMSINNNGAAPDSSAMLDVSSTSKGVLFPRMTQTQRNAIAGPAHGLMVYQTDNSEGLYVYDTASTSWIKVLLATDTTANNLAGVLANGNDAAANSILNLAALGIGTTTPSTQLEIYHNNDSVAMTLLSDDASQWSGVRLGNDQGNMGWLWTAGSTFPTTNYRNHLILETQSGQGEAIDIVSNLGAINFMTGTHGNVPRMVLDSAGNLGIGTATPTTDLHVSGTVVNGEVTTMIENLSDTGYSILRLRNDLGAQDLVLFRNGSDRNTDGGTNAATLRNDNGDLIVSSLNANLWLQPGTGSVGVGDTNTDAKLYVHQSGGNAALMLNQEIANQDIDIAFNVDDTTRWFLSATSPYHGFGEGWWIFNTNRGSRDFFIDGDNGNIGIGTITPDSRLHVMDSMRIQDSGNGRVLALLGNGEIESQSGQDLSLNRYNTNPVIIARGGGRAGVGEIATGIRFNVDGNLVADSIAVRNAFQFPITDGSNGQVMQTDGSGVLSWVNPAFNTLADTDNDTKIQVEESDDEDHIRFDIAGSQAMIIRGDNKRFGFAINNPETDLHISMDTVLISTPSNFSGTHLLIEGARHNSGSGIATIDFRNIDTSDGSVEYSAAKIESQNTGASDDGDLRFYTTNNLVSSLAMLVDMNGNVGIGETNPASLLEVGGKTTTQTLDAIYNGATTDAATSAIRFGDNFGDAFLGAGSTRIALYTTDSVERVSVLQSGEVGIGTTSPAASLHINFDGAPQLLVEPSSTTGNDGQITVRAARNTSTSNVHASIVFENYDNDLGGSNILGRVAGIVTNASANTGDMVFYTSTDGATESEAMRIDDDGKVGIGTSNPTSNLMLSSSDSTELYINGASVSDNKTITFGYNSGANSTGRIRESGTALELSAANGRDITFNVKGGQAGSALGIGSSVEEIMRVDGSGNVGVGTSSPTIKFHVDGGSDATHTDGSGYLLIGDESNNNLVLDDNEIMARSNASEGILYLQNDGGGVYIQNAQAGGSQVVIEDDGDVGIGVNSPATKLQVNGTGYFHNGSTAAPSTGTTGGNGDRLILWPGAAGSYPYSLGITGGTMWYSVPSSAIHSWYTGGSERMRLNSSGNIGIGTTSPSDVVHVLSSGGSPRYRAETTGSSYAGFVAENTNGEYFMGVQSTADGNSGEFHIYQNAGSGGSGQRMVIDHSGRMGIGQSNPTHILHINGQGRSTSSAWATSSDARAKQDIETITSADELLLKLRPVTFQWTPEYHDGRKLPKHTQYGFISQEVEEVIPEMVSEVEEVVGNDTIQDFKILDKDPLIALLVRSAQEQNQQISELQQQNSTLTEQVELLKRLLSQYVDLEENSNLHSEREKPVADNNEQPSNPKATQRR